MKIKIIIHMGKLIQKLSKSTIDRINNDLEINTDEIMKQNVEHFTEEEGAQRDQIVKEYFGEDGLKLLIQEISAEFTNQVNEQTTILDLGTGTGTFLIPIIEKLNIRNAYGFDLTPKMLQLLEMKEINSSDVNYVSIIGDMENIESSLSINRKHRQIEIPKKFDLIMSTLAFHHIPEIEKVLNGISEILDENGKAVVIDAVDSETSGMKPTSEHAHNGFDIKELKDIARLYFDKVEIRMLAITCTDTETDTETDLFLLSLENK